MMIGAVDTLRERLGYARYRTYEEKIGKPLTSARRTLLETEWEQAYQAGRHLPLARALQVAQKGYFQLTAAPSPGSCVRRAHARTRSPSGVTRPGLREAGVEWAP